MKKSSVLSEKTIKAIKKFIEKKKTEDNLMDQFPNTVLRDDVLEILGLYCTVVFYPLENEKNNGFHITGIPNRKGIEQHFVFINTAQSAEKQVFTAAHELGHVWAVDRQIEMEANVSFNSQERECVINRFAAELLMPEEHFIKIADSEFRKYTDENGGLTLLSLLKMVASLMNYFMSPEKAVIKRLGEIGALDDETVNMLTNDNSSVESVAVRKIVSDTIAQIVRSNGYTDLQKGSHKKAIKGLQDLLEEAEAKHSVAQSKIISLRNTFGISEPESSDKLGEKIDVFTIKGS